MNVKNLVKKATVAREYTELDIARMDYQEERPDYFDGETYEANGAELTDVFESEKVSKKGEAYINRFAKLSLFNDDEEEKVTFNITFWTAIKDGIAIVKPQNPLCNLIKYISDDFVNNSFTIDYKELQKILLEVVSIKVKVRVIDSRNGFETYGFDVEDIKFKEE